MEERLSVKADTIVRTVIMVVTLINQILTVVGRSPLPISDEQVELTVSTIITVVTYVWCFWKNNSFTQAALQADEVMMELKYEQDSD